MFVNPSTPLISIKPLNFILWFTLAFQAGAINVGGFLSCQRFVTHVTGFATHVGVDIASGALLEAISMAMVPVFFIFGCMTSAFFIDRRKHLGKMPYYTRIFFASGLLFLILSISGSFGVLGPFGQTLKPSVIFSLLAVLSFLSGVQNSMIGFASGLLVRTTHLTGITTDLGVGLMRMFYPRLKDEQKLTELKLNVLRMGTISAFIFGSILGGAAFSRFHFAGFLLPTGISFTLALYSWRHHQLTALKSAKTEQR